MKRWFLAVPTAILLALCLLSCSKFDIDLTKEDNIYDELAEFINFPQKCAGKTVRLSATYTVVYNFSENKILRHTLVEAKESDDGRALYEIRKEDGAYPRIGEKVTVAGAFSGDGYITVDEFENTAPDQLAVDIDALDLSADALDELITTFGTEYNQSEHYGKSIRIFGHCVNREGYYYLMGLDADGGMTWTIELYDPEGIISLDESEDNTVNPVEIIGQLTIYFEDNLAYACIEVKQVSPVESVFS